MGVIARGASGRNDSAAIKNIPHVGVPPTGGVDGALAVGDCGSPLNLLRAEASGRKTPSRSGSGTVGSGSREIMSPGVVSRAKRLLLGMSNMDTSQQARTLAGRALQAFGALT